MSNGLTRWNGYPDAPRRSGSAVVPLLPIAVEETKRRPLLLATLFAVIALTALVMGAMAPKKFTSTSSIRVQQGNSVDPMVTGREAPDDIVINHAGIAREIAFSRNVMDEILEVGGWAHANPTPLERAQLRDQIIGRTTISNPSQNANIIKISYSDEDAQRAQRVTKHFADQVVAANLADKAHESRTAFQFIDKQTDQYYERLGNAQRALADYYRANPDALPAGMGSSEDRIAELLRETDRARMDQIDQEAHAQALQGHLASERSIGASSARAGQISERLNELQAERDRLSLNYTERHPDLVRIEGQIHDMETQLQRELASPTRTASAAVPTSMSQAYGAVRGSIAEARSRSAASAARMSLGQQLIDEERERARQRLMMGGELADLTRDHENYRELYRGLLERRENARLAMYLDAAHGDLSFRIQEPAALPLQPTGMRLAHIGLAGLVLAVVLPLALLFGWLKVDPRVRSAAQIERSAGLPVLQSIPVSTTGRRHARNSRHLIVAAALVLVVPLAYTVALALR